MILKGIRCSMCGTPISSIPATEPGVEDRGHVSDRLLLCTAHRKVTATLLGESACQSPGRPAMSAVDARIQKYRRWRRHGIRSQAPSPDAPAMPRPTVARPSAAGPAMPVLGP